MKSLSKILFVFALIFGSCSSGVKVAYVDVNLLYESFDYKKKMSSEYNKIAMSRQHIADSLDMQLNYMSKEMSKSEKIDKELKNTFESKRIYLFNLQKQFEEDNATLLSTYDAKVIKQLNAYIKEFGDKNSYEVLLGADSKGTVLYGKKDLDKTKEIIEYVNKRYNGEKL